MGEIIQTNTNVFFEAKLAVLSANDNGTPKHEHDFAEVPFCLQRWLDGKPMDEVFS